jgi:hypothetical protein
MKRLADNQDRHMASLRRVQMFGPTAIGKLIGWPLLNPRLKVGGLQATKNAHRLDSGQPYSASYVFERRIGRSFLDDRVNALSTRATALRIGIGQACKLVADSHAGLLDCARSSCSDRRIVDFHSKVELRMATVQRTRDCLSLTPS